MKYRLYKESDDLDTISHVLQGRGIEDVDAWLHLDFNKISHWAALGENKMRQAVEMVNCLIQDNQRMLVLVDCDCDGYTSAAMFINYLTAINESYARENIDFFLHGGKEHGLKDLLENKTDLEQYAAIIVPDAGSNDFEEQKFLSGKGIKLLILDHHECLDYKDAIECENVILINNQACDYPNKNLSGGGIVWQFCRAFDEIKGYCYSSQFLDLCAVANLGDMMDYRSLETRMIILAGLKAISNPFLFHMELKNHFSMEKMGGINYLSCAFYIVPFVNATVRSGTPEEKEMIFKSFLTLYAFEETPSNKRGHKGEIVSLVEEAVRVCANIKSRQTKLQDEGMKRLEERIESDCMLQNSTLVFTCEPGEVEKSIAGLIANKLMSKYQRPCFVLTKSKSKDDKEYYYRGSARNYSLNEIEDLRQDCLDSELVEYAAGHASAFGVSIAEKDVDNFVSYFNKCYNVDSEPIYWVDYIWSTADIDREAILAIADMQSYWGQEIQESMVVVESIELSQCDIKLLSPDKHPTLKISLQNGVDLIKFSSSEKEYSNFLQSNQYLTVVGKCKKNEWNNIITPQIQIEDYVLEQIWSF